MDNVQLPINLTNTGTRMSEESGEVRKSGQYILGLWGMSRFPQLFPQGQGSKGSWCCIYRECKALQGKLPLLLGYTQKSCFDWLIDWTLQISVPHGAKSVIWIYCVHDRDGLQQWYAFVSVTSSSVQCESEMQVSMSLLLVKVLWPVRLHKLYRSWILFISTFQQVSGFYSDSGLFSSGVCTVLSNLPLGC